MITVSLHYISPVHLHFSINAVSIQYDLLSNHHSDQIEECAWKAFLRSSRVLSQSKVKKHKKKVVRLDQCSCGWTSSAESWRLFSAFCSINEGQMSVLDEERCFIDLVFFCNGFVRECSCSIPWVKANRYHRASLLKEAWYIYQTTQGTKKLTIKQTDNLSAKSMPDRMSVGRPRNPARWPNNDFNIPTIKEVIARSVPPLWLITGDILEPFSYLHFVLQGICWTKFVQLKIFIFSKFNLL